MKNKMINLFGKSKIVQNKGVKYSALFRTIYRTFPQKF